MMIQAHAIDSEAVVARLTRQWGTCHADADRVWRRWRITGNSARGSARPAGVAMGTSEPRGAAETQIAVVVRTGDDDDGAGGAEAWIVDLSSPGLEADFYWRLSTDEDVERFIDAVQRHRAGLPRPGAGRFPIPVR